MADNITTEERSEIMARVKSKGNKPELLVRKYLYHHGYRYRVNVAALPGKPDIVLRKYGAVIFVNGCFWHRHPYCKNTRTPKTNVEFWEQKFRRNADRDKRNYEELEKRGWKVIVVWECQVKKDLESTMKRVTNDLDANFIELVTTRKKIL